jgi:hypothetical protein
MLFMVVFMVSSGLYWYQYLLDLVIIHNILFCLLSIAGCGCGAALIRAAGDFFIHDVLEESTKTPFDEWVKITAGRKGAIAATIEMPSQHQERRC